MHVRTNDQIIVIAGAHKGQRGKIMRTDASRNRILIEGLNMRTKHLKKTADAPQGGIIEKEAWVSASNVLLYDNSAGQGVRTRSDGAGKDKRRVSVKNNEPLGAKK